MYSIAGALTSVIVIPLLLRPLLEVAGKGLSHGPYVWPIAVMLLVAGFLGPWFLIKAQEPIVELVENLEAERAALIAKLQAEYKERLRRKLMAFGPGLELSPDLAYTVKGVESSQLAYLHPEYRQAKAGRFQMVYQDWMSHSSRLLLLGDGGSGKSVLLLKIALGLLEEAGQNSREAIPIVLHLGTWQREFETFDEWLQLELDKELGRLEAGFKLGSGDDGIALLLDGLDEVPDKFRLECVKAILKHFISKPTLRWPKLVVCARPSIMDTLISCPLPVHAIAQIQDLAVEQVRHALAPVAAAAPGLPPARLLSSIEKPGALDFIHRNALYVQIALDMTAHAVDLSEISTEEALVDAYISNKIGSVSEKYKLHRGKSLKWLQQIGRFLNGSENPMEFGLHRVDGSWYSAKTWLKEGDFLWFIVLPLIVLVATNEFRIRTWFDGGDAAFSRASVLAHYIEGTCLFFATGIISERYKENELRLFHKPRFRLSLPSLSGVLLFPIQLAVSVGVFLGIPLFLSFYFHEPVLFILPSCCFLVLLGLVLVEERTFTSDKIEGLQTPYQVVIGGLFRQLFLAIICVLSVLALYAFLEDEGFWKLLVNSEGGTYLNAIRNWTPEIRAIPDTYFREGAIASLAFRRWGDDFVLYKMIAWSLYVVWFLTCSYYPFFKHFVFRFVLALQGRLPLRLVRYLRRMEETGLVVRYGGQWRFAHPLIQDRLAEGR